MGRKALGRGLDALMPGAASAIEAHVVELDVDRIRGNPYQPRERVEDARFEELVESIRQTGILQPIVVRRSEEGYEVIAGERRWRAAVKAGLRRIPAVVRDATDRDVLVFALIENIQRQDLNPVEEAQAYQTMVREFQMTQEEIAQHVGKPRATVANYLRLLKLPPPVLDMLRDGRLSMGHAKVLLSLETGREQIQYARRCVAGDWTVRRLEEQVRSRRARPQRRPDLEEDPDWQAARNELQRLLGTRVQFRRRGEKGLVVQLYFDSWEHLDVFFERVRRLQNGSVGGSHEQTAG